MERKYRILVINENKFYPQVKNKGTDWETINYKYVGFSGRIKMELDGFNTISYLDNPFKTQKEAFKVIEDYKESLLKNDNIRIIEL